MRIRTQLILAFLLLAIVPLTGIVLYSYAASLGAVRRATEGEARALTREMDSRMAAIRGELGRGVGRMGRSHFGELLAAARARGAGGANDADAAGKSDSLLDEVVLGFGAAAPFVDSLELISDAPQPPPAAPPPPGAAVVPPRAPNGVQVDVPQILREVRRGMRSVPGVPAEALAELDKSLEQAVPLKIELYHRLRDRLAGEARERSKADQQRANREHQRSLAQHAALARAFEVPVMEGGEVIGKVRANVRGEAVLRDVLARTRSEPGDVPFALDPQGTLHTVNDDDRTKIEHLPLADQAKGGGTDRHVLGDWAVATERDADSGIVFGIARPVPLAEVKRTAARNFGYGLGLIGIALLGILPLSTHITRNLRLVTAGADRIAQGDLETRIPVRSRSEFGVLARTFNRMAEDLKRHQEREIEQAVLHQEYERKSRELEEARSFQLALLPKTLPDHPGFQIAVSMRTATEVGGDYYDFHLDDDGALTAAIGDATGHGARAGTMVTAVKSLFSADAGASGPRQFLAEAARAVKRMALDRMAMGLSLVRLAAGTLTVSAAGMPPLLLYRARTGRAEEVALAGMPLGGLAFEYEERSLAIEAGDTVLLMTDGLPELINADGEPLGYPKVRAVFESLGARSPEDIIAGLSQAADAWTAGAAPKDDITFVVIRARSGAVEP